MARPRTKPLQIAPADDTDDTSQSQELVDETRVHKAIVDAVLSQKLPPGTRLVETPLCEAFGVNRSLLRRVLVRLANEKVVELQHNKGAAVAQPTQTEMHEVFEVRRLIEGGLMRRLCACARPGDITGLRRLVDDETQAYQNGDRTNWIRLSGEYHLAAARILGNHELEEIMNALVARTTLMKALYIAPGRNVCSFEEHTAILDAIAAGDAELACRLMDEHLQSAERKLRLEPPSTDIDLLKLFGQRS